MPSSQLNDESAAGAAGNTTPRIPVNTSVLNPRIQESPRTKRFCPCPSVLCASNPATLTGPCASKPETLTGQKTSGLPPTPRNQHVEGTAEHSAAAATPRKSRWFKRPFSSKASQAESPRGHHPSLASPRPAQNVEPAQPIQSLTGAIPVGYTSNQASVRYQAAQNAAPTQEQPVPVSSPVSMPPPVPSSYMPHPTLTPPAPIPAPMPAPIAAPTPAPAPAPVLGSTPAAPSRVVPSASSSTAPVCVAAEPVARPAPAPTAYQLGPAAAPEDPLAPLSEEIGQLQQQLQLLSTSLNQLATGNSAPSSNPPGAFPPVSEDNMSALMRQLNSLNASIIRLGQGQTPAPTQSQAQAEKKTATGASKQAQSKIQSGSLSAREEVSSPRPPLPPNTTSVPLTHPVVDQTHLKTGESLRSNRHGSLTSQNLYQTMSQPGQAVPLTGRLSSGSGSTSGGRGRVGPGSLSGKLPSSGQVLSGDSKTGGESDYVDIGGQLSQVMHQLESMKSGDATAKTGSFPDRNLSSDYMDRLPGWKAELDSIQQELADYYQGPPGESTRSSRRRPRGQDAVRRDEAVAATSSNGKPSQRVAVGVESRGRVSQSQQSSPPQASYNESEPADSSQSHMMDNPGSVSKPLLNSGGNASDWNSSTLSVDSSSAPLTPLSLPGAGRDPELTTLNADDAGRFGEGGRRNQGRPLTSRPSGATANIGLVLGQHVSPDDVSPFEQAEMEAARGGAAGVPATWTDDTATMQDVVGGDKQRRGGGDAWAPGYVTGTSGNGAGGSGAGSGAQRPAKAVDVAQGYLGLLNLDTANSSLLHEAKSAAAGKAVATGSELLVTADSQEQQPRQQDGLLTMSSATESWVMRFKEGGPGKDGPKGGFGGRNSRGSEDGSHGSMSDAGRRINSIEAHLQELQASGYDFSKGSDSDREELARILMHRGDVSDAQAAADLAWVAGLRRAARSGARRRASAPTNGAALVMHGAKPKFTRVRPPTVHLSSDTPTLGGRRMFLTGGSVGGGVSSGEHNTAQVIDGRRRKRHGSTDSCDINDGAVSSCVNSVEVEDLAPDSPGPGGFYLHNAAAGVPAVQANIPAIVSPGSDAPVKAGLLNPSVHRPSIGTSPRQTTLRSRFGVKPGTVTAERTSAGGSSTMSSQSSYPAELSLPSSQPSGPTSSENPLSPVSDGAASGKSKSDASVSHAGDKPLDPGMALPTLLSGSSEGSFGEQSPKAQAGSPVNTAEITAQLDQLVVDAATIRKRSRRLSKCSPRSTGGNYAFAPDSPMVSQGNVKLSTWSHNQWAGDVRSVGTSASAEFGNRHESPGRMNSLASGGQAGQMVKGTWGTRSTDSLSSMPWMAGRRRFVTRRTGSSSSQASPRPSAVQPSLALGSERSSQDSADPQVWQGEGRAPVKATRPEEHTDAAGVDSSADGLRNVTNIQGGNVTAYFMSSAPTRADMDVLVRLERGDVKHPGKKVMQGKVAQQEQMGHEMSVMELLGVVDTTRVSDQSKKQVSEGLIQAQSQQVQPTNALASPENVLDTGDTYGTADDTHATHSIADSADTAFTTTDAGAKGLLHVDAANERLTDAAPHAPQVGQPDVQSPVLATPEKRSPSPDSVRLAASFYQRVSPASTQSQPTPGRLSPVVNASTTSPSPGVRASLSSSALASPSHASPSPHRMVTTPVKVTPVKGATNPSASLYSGGVSTPPRMGFTPKSPLLDSVERTPYTSPEHRPWLTSPNLTAPPPSPEITPGSKHHPRVDTGVSQSDITHAISSMIRSRTSSIYATPTDVTSPTRPVSRALPMSTEEPETSQEKQTTLAVLPTSQPKPGTALGQLAARFDASSGEADMDYPPAGPSKQERERPTSPDFIPSCGSFNKPHLQPDALQKGAQPDGPQPASFGWDNMLAHPPQLSMMPTAQPAGQRTPSRPFAMAPLMAFSQPLSPVSTTTTFTVDSSIVESPMQPVRPAMKPMLHSSTDPEPSRSSVASGSEAWMSTRDLQSNNSIAGTAVADTPTGNMAPSGRRISFAIRSMSSGGSRLSGTHSDLQSGGLMDTAFLASCEGVNKDTTPKHGAKKGLQAAGATHKSPPQGVAESVEGPVMNPGWAGLLMPQRPSATGGAISSPTNHTTVTSMTIKGAGEGAADLPAAAGMNNAHLSSAFSLPDVVLQVPLYEGPEMDLMRSMDSIKSRNSLVLSPKSPVSEQLGSARVNTPRIEASGGIPQHGGVAPMGTPPRPQSQLAEHVLQAGNRSDAHQSLAAVPSLQNHGTGVVSNMVSPRPQTPRQSQVRPPPSPRIPNTPRSHGSHASTPAQVMDARVSTPSTVATTLRTAAQSGSMGPHSRCASPSRQVNTPRLSGEPGYGVTQPGSPSGSWRERGPIHSGSSDDGARRLNFEWWQRPEVDRHRSRSPSPAPRRTHSQSTQGEDTSFNSQVTTRSRKDKSKRKHRHPQPGRELAAGMSSDVSEVHESSTTGNTTDVTGSIPGSDGWDSAMGCKHQLMSTQSTAHSHLDKPTGHSALLSSGDQHVPYTPGASPPHPGNVNKYNNFVNAMYDMSPRVTSGRASSTGGPGTPPQLCSAGVADYSTTSSPTQRQVDSPQSTTGSLSHQSSAEIVPVSQATHQGPFTPGMTTYTNPSYPYGAGPQTGANGLADKAGVEPVERVASPTSTVPESNVSDDVVLPMAPVHNLNLTLDAKFLAMDPQQQDALTTDEKKEHGKVLAQQLKAIMDALGHPCVGSPTSGGGLPFETLQGLLTGASVPEALKSIQLGMSAHYEDGPSPTQSLDAETLQALLASMATSLDGLKEQTGVALDVIPQRTANAGLLHCEEIVAADDASLETASVVQGPTPHGRPTVPPLGRLRASVNAGAIASGTSVSSPTLPTSPPLSSRSNRRRPGLNPAPSGEDGNGSAERGRLVAFKDANIRGLPAHAVVQDPVTAATQPGRPHTPMSARAAPTGSGLSFAKSWSVGGSAPISPAGAHSGQSKLAGERTSSGSPTQSSPSVVVYKTTPRNARSVERQRPGANKRDNKCTVQ